MEGLPMPDAAHTRTVDLLLTALAPMIWGTTYVVTTQMLPGGYPVTLALLRALPAGMLLLLVVRQLPRGIWWGRIFLLGALNFTLFWICLFIAAYRLPGGVAATVGAVQPLLVLGLARVLLGTELRGLAVVAALLGLAGVALLILGPQATLEPLGLLAGLGGALSMAMGSVLTRKWQPPVSLLTFTAWQLTAGGLLLLPLALWLEPPLPPLNGVNLLGLIWLGLVGAALTYFLWFRGLRRVGPNAASALGFLSPVTAVVAGWALLGQSLSPLQLGGLALVALSLWLGPRAMRQA
ncbi:EamA family transporter [Phaeovulum sp. W22_SRMD_FR3]|uniref:EamA family transporter n=1 Tax=Phaeovulum sp. W22_SRMD_FR3 TaxID=3240274 RepID=UPI003F947648